MWEGVLFHLALLPCARQVVKRREGASKPQREREQYREGEREACRKRRTGRRRTEKEKGWERNREAALLSFSCQSK